jgi:hypothetical protein
MGVNPAHFNGAAGTEVTPVIDNACNDIWPQFAWQAGDRVSRDELAQEIANAERDIADFINYWPAPVWIAQEHHPYPRHHRPDVIRHGGYDVRGYRVAINADYGYIIAPGQRDFDIVGDSVAVTLSSEDGDASYNETATVSTATTLTDACEVKVYFEDKNAAQEWEIRPARTKSISGAGLFTATFWAWQLIDPDLWDALPTVDGQSAIDWTDADNIVNNVDVYREYNDTTATSSQFYWEPCTQPLDWSSQLTCGCGGTGCAACALTTQTGCLHLRNPVTGIVVPEPASYSATDAAWSASCWTECRDPDMVKLWYYAGHLDDRWRRGEACEPLSRWWQQTIAWMATARLERPFCSCKNLAALAQHLRADMAALSEQQSYAISPELLMNPFGTRRGEVLAWQRVSKLVKKRMSAAVV